MAVLEPDVLLKNGFQWFVIPHGLNPVNGKLRISIRVVPRLTHTLIDSPIPAGKVNGKAARDLLRDWPGFLHKGVRLEIAACAEDAVAPDPASPVVSLDLTQYWRAQLDARGINSVVATGLWRAIVRPGLTIKPVGNLTAPKVLPEFPQREGANTLRKVLGGIYSQSLAAATRPGASGQHLPGQVSLALREAQRDLIDPLARYFPTLEKVESDVPAEMKWYVERLGAVGLRLGKDQQEALVGRFMSWRKGESFVPIGLTPENQLPLLIFDRFLAMIPELDKPLDTQPEPAEFHQELAKLTLHPWLLETVGLSVAAEIDPALLEGNRNALHVAAITSVHGTDSPEQRVRVVCSLAAENRYYPSEKNDQTFIDPGQSRYVRGCVNLGATYQSEALFTLEQLETDALSEKLIQVAQSWRTQVDAGVKQDLREVKLTPLPTTGIALLMGKPAEQLKQRYERARQQALLSDSWQTCYAQDLIVGYRPDIAALAPDDRGGSCLGPWKSLVGRQLATLVVNRRSLNGQFLRLPHDEGIVTTGARMLEAPLGSGNKKESARIPSQELFRWRGWGLACSAVECQSRRARTGVQEVSLTATYKSAGGLPQLRIGRGYRVGMRAVFMDGRSVTLEEARQVYSQQQGLTLGMSPPEPANEQAFFPLLRYEPVQSPSLLMTHPLKRDAIPGQRIDFLAVASDAGNRMVIHSTERVLVPPRIDLNAAIHLGMFDSNHRAPPKGAFAGVRLKDNGSFPAVGEISLRDRFGDDKSGDPGYVQDPKALRPKVPYLPDPWAERLIIGIYRCDGALLGYEYHDYYDDKHIWPDCKPLILRIETARFDTLRAEGYDVAWQGNTLVFKVAPGIALKVGCWHELTERRLAQSGIVDTMAHYLTGAPACAQMLDPNGCSTEQAQDGLVVPLCDRRDLLIQCLSQWHRRRSAVLHPFLASGRTARDINLTSFSSLNPACQMEVAHLVPLPVRAAQFCEASFPAIQNVARLPTQLDRIALRFEADRNEYGQTVATFHGDIELHRSSTLRLECYGQWQEFTDEVGLKPQIHTCQQSMFTFESIVPVLDPPQVNGAAEPAADNDLLLLNGVRQSIYRNTNSDLLERQVQYDFVDAKARLVTFNLQAVSRFLKHYPSALQPQVVESGPRTSRWIKATKPPAPPAVAYVVPLLKSFTQAQGQQRIQHRHGNAFRIWLERPWYSSGEGELLALVCWPGDLFRPRGGTKDYLLSHAARVWGTLAKNDVPHNLRELYTGWGHDPIWEQQGKLDYMPPGAFANRMDTGLVRVTPSQLVNRHKPQPTDERVSLALYQPQYHEAEQRWYVDVVIKPDDNAYYPFVRLCLARYQPNAIEGCELSEIVSTEFIQLIPERVASVQVRTAMAKTSELDITLAGPSSLRLSEDIQVPGAGQLPCNRIVVRVDQAHGPRSSSNTQRDIAWVPVSTLNGQEETELEYHNGLWVLPRNKPLSYRLDPDAVYSVYLEELQAIKVDKEPTSPPLVHPYLPESQYNERLVYVDRVILPPSR